MERLGYCIRYRTIPARTRVNPTEPQGKIALKGLILAEEKDVRFVMICELLFLSDSG